MEQEIKQVQFQMRELNEHVLDEQRVCFKQFNLETSESFALSDRAHRHTRTRLDDLARQIEELRRSIAERGQPPTTAQANSTGRVS